MADSLLLPEQFLLLCLHDETGKIEENRVGVGLNGAVLLELLLLGRIRLDAKRRVVVEDQTPTGDELLDRMLSRMARVGPAHPIVHWIGIDLGKPSNAQLLLDRLVDRGILRKEQDGRFLGLFRQYRYPTDNASPEDSLRSELHSAITGSGPVGQRLSALIGLLDVCHALDRILPYEQEKQYRERIAEIRSGNSLVQSGHQAVGDVVAQVDTLDLVGWMVAEVGYFLKHLT